MRYRHSMITTRIDLRFSDAFTGNTTPEKNGPPPPPRKKAPTAIQWVFSFVDRKQQLLVTMTEASQGVSYACAGNVIATTAV